MKKEILDAPFRDSFSDFLEKGETILWKKTLKENIKTPLIFNDEGQISFHLKQVLPYFFYLVSLSILVQTLIYEKEGINWVLIITPFVFGIIGLPRMYRTYGTKIHQTKYAITQKRILFRLSHLPKNEIQQIPFSQIRSFIPLENGHKETAFILVIKNPESVLFETGHHQPTLEDIKDIDKVAHLIHQGIKNANTLA